MPARLPRLLLLTVLLPSCGGLFEEKDDDDDWNDDDEAEVDTGPSGSGGGSGSGSGDGGSGSGSGDGGSGSGSGGSGGDGSDGTGDDGGSIEFDLNDVDPNHGTNAGGTVVSISGGPFDPYAEVFFGGEPATIQYLAQDRIEVIAPATAAEGPVDIVVESDMGAGQMAGGFTYWADATGQYGALGFVSFTKQVGSYWSSTPGPGEGQALVYFTEPIETAWFEFYAPSLDTCRKEGTYAPSVTITTIDPGVSTITLRPDFRPIVSLEWDPSTTAYSNDGLTDTTYEPSSSWALITPAGSTLPEIELSDFAQTPSAPVLTSPSITGTSAPSIDRFHFLNWSPSGADWMLITLTKMDSSGSNVDEIVHCVAEDDGSFTVDGSQFASWSSGRIVYINFNAVIEASGILPWNQAGSQVVGMYGVLGAGFSD